MFGSTKFSILFVLFIKVLHLVKWTVEIGHMIKVMGSFHGPLTPVDRLCLRVKYGIDQSQLFFIKEDDLTRVDEQKWTFETKVRLTSSKIWSTCGKLELIFEKSRLFYLNV